MHQENYINATQENGKRFFQKGIKGNVTMLNMLRFKETADYSKLPHLTPTSILSGEEAYKLYMEHTLPFLKEAGSEILYYGKGGSFLIGPESENWDVILLVKHASVKQFMEFAANEDYLKTAGHRTAALEDSRLLPLEEYPSF